MRQGQKVAPRPLNHRCEMTPRAYLIGYVKAGIGSHYNGIFSVISRFARLRRIVPALRLTAWCLACQAKAVRRLRKIGTAVALLSGHEVDKAGVLRSWLGIISIGACRRPRLKHPFVCSGFLPPSFCRIAG